MKKLCLFFILMFSPIICLVAEETPQTNLFQNYVAAPGLVTFEQTFKHYSGILSEDPENDTARIMLSYLFLMEMERTLEQIDVEGDSIAPNIPFNYANILLELRRFEEAIDIYDLVNTKYPNWSCPWRHKGEAYFKLGEYTEAETALKKAIETRVEHYDAYVMLAEAQEAMGTYEEALVTLETGFSYKGKDIEDPEEEVSDLDTQFLYLRLLEKNDKTGEALRQKEKLMNIAPEDERWGKM